MRKFYLFLLLMMLSIIMLPACGENDATPEDNSQDVEVEETNNEEQNSDENKTEVVENEEDESKESTEVSSPSGVEEIFQKVAEAMSAVGGMNITGEIISSLDMGGIVENTTTQITGEVSMNPFTQYIRMDSVSDMEGATTTEMYVTEESMYMNDPESGGWFSLPIGQGGDVGAVISEDILLAYGKISDLFKLTEDNDHYIITFEGSGEEYKRVAFGPLKEMAGDEAYLDFGEMITEGSGVYEFTIDKSTFYIVAMKMDTKQSMDVGLENHSMDQINYEYSGFGEVGEITVPDEVVENAQDLNALGGMGGD